MRDERPIPPPVAKRPAPAQRSPDPADAIRVPTVEEWWVRTDAGGEQSITFAGLQKLVERGVVTADTPVRRERDSLWAQAGNFAELFPREDKPADERDDEVDEAGERREGFNPKMSGPGDVLGGVSFAVVIALSVLALLLGADSATPILAILLSAIGIILLDIRRVLVGIWRKV